MTKIIPWAIRERRRGYVDFGVDFLPEVTVLLLAGHVEHGEIEIFLLEGLDIVADCRSDFGHDGGFL